MHDFSDLSYFTLAFELRQSADDICLLLHYEAELASAEGIEQLGAHYFRAVTFLAENPTAELAAFELLHDEERRQILDGLNDTLIPRPERLSLQSLFEQRAELHPEAIAVVFEREKLTYGEVNRHANRLAHNLRSQLALQAGQPVA